MFNLSDDPFDFAVYYFGLATGPFDARTDYTGKRPQAKQLMARERSIPRIYTLAKYLQQQMPLSLNEIALILFYVRSARSDGGFVNAPTCECRIETAEANPALVLDAVAGGLMTLSQQAPGRGWRLTGGILQSAQRPDAFQLRGACSYEWAPASIGYDGIAQTLMNLECTATLQSNSVSLVLAFEDQAAWLFEQAQKQVQIAVEAITGSLAYHGLPAQSLVSGLLTPYQALQTFTVLHLNQPLPA